MLVGVTGTPGTGKTSVCKLIQEYKVIYLNSIVKNQKLISGRDKKRDTTIVDLEGLKKMISKFLKNSQDSVTIMESHYSHLLNPDMAIVLRTNPKELAQRLKKKGYSREKIMENVEAELVDVILVEALESCKEVFEIDTTAKHNQRRKT
jgi:adenylate kinase